MRSKNLSINGTHLVLMCNVKDAPFKCLACKKVFISEIHLRRHEERRHQSKELDFLPVQAKESFSTETANGPAIKAVLNATERIEDLLIKLALKEKETSNYPRLACNSPRNNAILAMNSSSTDISVALNEDCKSTLNDNFSNENLKQVPSPKYRDFLYNAENNASRKVTSSVFENYFDSNNIINPIFNTKTEVQCDGGVNVISLIEDGYFNEKSSINCRSRVKDDIIRKLNGKLELYGINYNQNTLSDNEFSRIRQLLKYERDHIAEKVPELYKLRELINNNAERMVEENLQNRSVYNI